MKQFYQENKINLKTLCWAQGMDGWRALGSVPQLKWTMVASRQPLMNETELATHILSILITICKYFPSRDSKGAIIRPIPRAKFYLSDTSYLPHIVQSYGMMWQLLLTFDPVLVEKVALLVEVIMQDNPNLARLFHTGFFFFILMYTGSNLLPIGRLLKSSHLAQAFRADDAPTASSIMQRSILGQLLPEAMVCYLENHGPEKFAEIFLGEFDTPEAIWNNEMRRMMIEKISVHLADFTPRLRSNTRSLYSYCAIPLIQYPQLENELFCNIYYLRHLCDTIRFPEWPIAEPLKLLKDVLEAWKQEIEKKPSTLTVDDAYEALNLTRGQQHEESTVRKAYFRLAQQYHPDKNPEGRVSDSLLPAVSRLQPLHLRRKSLRKSTRPTSSSVAEPPALQKALTPSTLCSFSRPRAFSSNATKKVLSSHHVYILFLLIQPSLPLHFPAITNNVLSPELHPYRYSGYPMLIQTIRMETSDEQLFSKSAPLLAAAAETCFHTVNCSALNVEELRREGGLEVLKEAFTRCVAVLSKSSTMDSLPVQVCMHIARCFAVASHFAASRERLIDMVDMIRDLCRILYYKHLFKLCSVVVETISAFAVDETLQSHLYHAGVLYHLLMFFFQYDFTLEESGVEKTEDTNQQEVANQLAKLSIIACARLGGYIEKTPPNLSVRRALDAMLTHFVVEQFTKASPAEVLKLLTCNTENPYILWNNGTRAELMEYLEGQRDEKIRSGECDPSLGADFKYSAYQNELIIGDIFVRIYNQMPSFPLENAKEFTLKLLDYLGSQAQYLHSLASLSQNGALAKATTTTSPRLHNIEMALEALKNVILNNPGVELKCVGHFKLLFSLLQLDNCPRIQAYTIQNVTLLYKSGCASQAVAGVTGNQECINDIASADVLVYLLLVLHSFQDTPSQTIILETLLPLMANPKLVKDAMNKGMCVPHLHLPYGLKDCWLPGLVIYVLDLFCNSSIPRIRELGAELLGKVMTDKLHGPKIRIDLSKFLPTLFLDAMKDFPATAIQLFEGIQENPELIWNDESRETLCSIVSSMSNDKHLAFKVSGQPRYLCGRHYAIQRDKPTAHWNNLIFIKVQNCFYDDILNVVCQNPQEDVLTLPEHTGELLVGGVYVRLFLQTPSYVLRRPREFLTELLDRIADPKGADPEMLGQALVSLLQAQPALLELLPATGHLSRIPRLLESAPHTGLGLLRELPASESCMRALASGPSFLRALATAAERSHELIGLACEALNRLFQSANEDLVQQKPLTEVCVQAVDTKLVDFLLTMLESRLDVANPSATKAQIVQALTSLSLSARCGEQVQGILQKSAIWSEYKDQKHDLFISDTAVAGYLTGK
ncbi:DNAJC13 [Cordylochernes scorpioides]|uniref:DNAJC13 n=1 Tax=Cordylochernes scorpioides TaxID=51811 RepID=A0ABY6K4J7_9ARAC|nr:DNAJC13 [Cordylochernes scorpioides]